MPELPEVEQFRQLLLPLVSTKNPLEIALVKDNPPKVWLTPQQVQEISGNFYCSDVIRKGKQLCLVLSSNDVRQKKNKSVNNKYLFLHMGMTGSIRNPDREPCWGHENAKVVDVEYPPKFTYMTLSNITYEAAFADPRKFGKAILMDDLKPFDLLAPDALTCNDRSTIEEAIIPSIAGQSRGIKAILLDQNRVCSGVGNWVADEVLYQIGMHPDQQFLTLEQARELFSTLQSILAIAVDCLVRGAMYPETWLFHFRWTKKKAGKDHAGRTLTFLTSGGRTSAIVASKQKLYKSQGKKSQTRAPKPPKATETKTPVKEEASTTRRGSKEKSEVTKKEGRKRKATSAKRNDVKDTSYRRSKRLREASK